MRIFKKGYNFIKPGAELKEERKKEPKEKKAARPMTAAQKRKVEELRQRIKDRNSKILQKIGFQPKDNTEIR